MPSSITTQALAPGRTTNVRRSKKNSFPSLVQITGEPSPSVLWLRGNEDVNNLPGVRSYQDNSGCHLEIDKVGNNNVGKYSVVAANLAGKTTKSVTIQSVHSQQVFNAYQGFKR